MKIKAQFIADISLVFEKYNLKLGEVAVEDDIIVIRELKNES